MERIFIPITKKEYDTLKPLPILEQHKKFLEVHDKSGSLEYGYGFYALTLRVEVDGDKTKYIADCLIGSSCD